MNKKLNKIFNKSTRLSIDVNSKIVIMSDCHRGAGNNSDNFLKNKPIYLHALHHYYQKDFTYIELGDGDEMWEVKNYEDIISTHLDVFKMLKKFYHSKRLIMIYGNHDLEKKYPQILATYFYKYYDKFLNQEVPLLDDLIVHESLILNYQDHDIFLLHGHQVDFFNSTIWKFSRFLVRNVSSVMEKFGIKNFTSAAKNNHIAKITEKKLRKWSSQHNKIIIAGHTHRPVFPKNGDSLYFNDGSCLFSKSITCLEIEQGSITLVEWRLTLTQNKIPQVKRIMLSKNVPIINFFK